MKFQTTATKAPEHTEAESATYEVGKDAGYLEAAGDYKSEIKDLRRQIGVLASSASDLVTFMDRAGSILVDAGAPGALMPLERVQWAARRLTEQRPISDERVRLIHLILDNLRAKVDGLPVTDPVTAVWSSIKDLEGALKIGTHLGRDDAPYEAAARITDASRADNRISEWFGPGRVDPTVFRFNYPVLAGLIQQAIEDQVALATKRKTDLLIEVAGAMTGGREIAPVGGNFYRSLQPGPGSDDKGQFDDLLRRIEETLGRRTGR